MGTKNKKESEMEKLRKRVLELKQQEKKHKLVEEELKAANQQLAAKEQQFRAANQQLAANEQQLRAANKQLKANEKKLKKSKETTERYLNIAAEVIISLDANGNITLLNESGHYLLGYKKGELIGKNWFQNCLPERIKNEVKGVFTRIMLGKAEAVTHYESDIRTKTGETRTILWHNTVLKDKNGKNTGTLSSGEDITERKKAERELKKIEWLLEKEKKDSPVTAKDYIPEYGDVTKLNTERTILDNAGADTLKTLCADIMDLLDTSIAIYEKNGDYAYGQFDSTWCQVMDNASFKLCNTNDTKEALICGKWLCHENCWNDSGKEAINTQKPTDIECVGGIHLYAVPIYAGRKLIGSINMGYGNPPTDEKTLKELAEKFHVDYNILAENSHQYKARPPFINENAKKRVHTVAQLIGKIVDSAQKEKQVKQSEEKFKRITVNSPDAIFIVNPKGDYIYVNPKATDLLGYTREELVQMNIADLAKPGELQTYLTNFKKIPTDGQLLTELELVKKNGSKIPVDLNATLLPDGNIYGSCRDITERKKAEEILKAANQQLVANEEQLRATNQELASNEQQLKAANQQLTANEQQLQAANQQLIASEKELIAAKEIIEISEERFRKAQEVGHIGSWEYNLQNDTFWGSDEGKKMYNLTQENDKFSVQEVMECVIEQDREQVNQAMIDLVNEDKPYDIIFTIIPKNTSDRKIIRSIAELQKNEKGEPIKVLGVLHDITPQKTIEKKLIVAKEKAEEADQLKSAFLANMSHEIRTPMNGILGFTNLLQEQDLTGKQRQKYIDIIKRSGNRMLNTVNDLIDISRIETGQVEISMDEIDVQKELESLYFFFRQEAENKGLQLLFNQKEVKEPVALKTDPAKFTSIVSNLIKNAIKYTRKGTVEFGYKKQTNSLFFYIEDTGIGIPKNRQEAIFNRFVQADIADNEAFEGSGLGLAISKAYVEMLDGEMGLESEKGVGSTFWFKLPLAATEKNDVKSNDKKPATATSEPFKKLKILIAEDDETSSQHLSIVLKKLKPVLLYSTTGRETIELCKKHQDIDIILMDVKMPDINGYDATKKIREFNKEVVIIAQTACALSDDRQKALDAGCSDYIAKPIKTALLIKKIKQFNN